MTDILVTDFIIVILIFTRIIGVFSTAPIFGNRAIPIFAKIGLSIVISYIVFLTIDTSKIVVDPNLFAIAFLGAKELLTGIIMGFIVNFVFWGISFSGFLIGFDMGLMMSEVMNPLDDTQGNVMGEILFYAAVMMFFIINGHHYIITGVVSSFAVIPIGKYTINEPVFNLLVKYSFMVFTIAVKIASPIMVSFFLVHLAEGIIAKVIPNIQVFFVTQPIKIGLGLVVIIAVIPFYIVVVKYLLQGYEYQLLELIRAMGA
ncbi:MAG: flagellar biosynthetic protein FliR [Melioribacteraceae bacterium]|nr:flagellar biosynthetic protein FliR [Melioribacteraceae bacterium]